MGKGMGNKVEIDTCPSVKSLVKYIKGTLHNLTTLVPKLPKKYNIHFQSTHKVEKKNINFLTSNPI